MPSRKQLERIGLLVMGALVALLPARAAPSETAAAPSLEQALAQLKVPPDWMGATPVIWDTARPWSEARLEIRRLLALDDLPAAPWRIASVANIHDRYGDLYAERGDLPKAREHYAEAIRLYPTSDQPYGRHLIPRYSARVRSKLDRLAMQSLATTRLQDGTYTGRAMGYSDKQDLEVTLTIRTGKITDVNVKHEEKIDLNATRLVPQQILEKQSLQVDGVTGATITSQAIVEGAFRALKQAGLP